MVRFSQTGLFDDLRDADFLMTSSFRDGPVFTPPPLDPADQGFLTLVPKGLNTTPQFSAVTSTSADGTEYISLINTGSSDNRVDIWYVADGYTSFERQDALDDIMAQFSDMTNGSGLNAPFGRYQNFFNVHVVFAPSAESGADRPDDGVFVDTAFDASFSWGGGPERLLYLNTTKAEAAIASIIPAGVDIDMRFAIINTEKYGGGGGLYASFAGKNSFAFELALHEVGHAYIDLADEYWTDGTSHNGGEPFEANITTDPGGTKWSHWLGYDDGVLGPVGAFEGGYYVETGIYRPTDDSKMRSLNRPFDAIAQEAFIHEFYNQVDPIDDTYASHIDGSIINPASLFADVIDPSVFDFSWSIDGGDIISTDNILDLTSLDLAPGTYDITLLVQDLTDKVRIDLDLLQEAFTWQIEIASGAITGSDQTDLIFGTDGNDEIFGDAGHDEIYGNAGDDEIYGGSGDDSIMAGAGDNYIEGGEGNDLLMGS